MSEKKMVRRSVAVALGIICILLIAFIAYFSIAGISAQNSYNNLQSEIDQLQTWLDGNKTLLNQTQIWLDGNITNHETQISTLNERITQLQTWLTGNITAYNDYVNGHHHTDEDYYNFYTIAIIGREAVWAENQTVSEPAGGLGIAWYDLQFPANYAGYVRISVLSANASTWTHVIYSAGQTPVNYNTQINVGTSGSAFFPILPSSNITVGVGNGNLNNGATQRITIAYYY
jgi:hypothetical protein